MTEKSISQTESWAVLGCSMAAATAAVVWSWHYDAMLNYGDAVAHLHIARRVFDSRTPRFSQLGSVWLPLPHILLLPFVQDYEWWATGLAGVIPSLLAYLAACAGIYRLARHWLTPSPAVLALAFFALNPNLLYLQTTAMTEPLFLCEMIWIVVWMVEWRVAIHQEVEASTFALPPLRTPRPIARRRLALLRSRPLHIFDALAPRQRGAWIANPGAPRAAAREGIFANRSNRLQVSIAGALVAAIFTRYDGWIIALLAWTGVGLVLRKYRRLNSPVFWLASVAVVAAPILWFTYNSVAFGDWLYFARGPYSAKAIELRTSAPGSWPPHPGWHNLWVALLYYGKVAELDAIGGWGNIVLALGAVGTLAALLAEKAAPFRRALAWTLLLWLPIPFYSWSVAYGSVPIFFPAWWPYTWYNTRYGLELLPALALGLGFAAHFAMVLLGRIPFSRFTSRLSGPALLRLYLPVMAYTIFFALAGLNIAALLRHDPVVYEEGTKNLDARLPYDDAIPPLLDDMLAQQPRAPVLMNTSAYPEIVSLTGIPLRQTINESDLEIFRAALSAPATSAAIVVAFDGDEIDRAVKAHPKGLSVAGRFTAKDQPSATVYFSTSWFNNMPNMF